MSAAPEVGDVLDGKYRLEARLGEGGMGVVFRAEHLKLQRKVAIKLLQPSVVDDPETVARFQREARAAGQLESRHVAKILDVEEVAGVHYMVMELLEGHDLDHELTTRGHLPVDEAVEYVLQACEGVVEAHAHGIVHRDLKPSNLFLAKDRNGGVSVKLLDFGISKIQSDTHVKLTAADASMGTPLYMSPEQVRAAALVGAATDQWSLGIILFELISGGAPFAGHTATAVAAAIVADPLPSLSSVGPAVPPELEAVLRRALNKDPKARYASVEGFAAALRETVPHLQRRVATPEALDRTHVDRSRSLRPGVPAETNAGTTRNAGPSGARASRVWIGAGLVALVLGGGAAAFVATRGSATERSPATTAPASERFAAQPAETAPLAATPLSQAPPPEVAATLPVITPSVAASVSAPPAAVRSAVVAQGQSTTRRAAPVATQAKTVAATATAAPTVVRPPPPPDNPDRL